MKKGYKGIITLLVLIVCTLITIFMMGFSVEKPVVISKSVIDSIYLQNNFSSNYYDQYINNTNNIDNNITNESLHNIKYLTIDANNVGNSDFLKYLKNLEVLTINNYQNLSQQDINNLKYLKNINVLYINIDGNYVLKNPNYTIDLSIFSNLETLYISCDLPNEIDAYISYNLIKDNKIKNVIFRDNLTIEELNIWDGQITNIINSLNLENENEKEKVYAVANYVSKNLSYDQEINNYLKNNTNVNVTDKIYNYNINLLSSILNNNNQIKNVICCNYAAFTNIILYKLGIESYYIIGNADGVGHAWNLVNVDNNYYFIDLTYFDNNYNKGQLLISENKIYSNYSLPEEEGKEQIVYYNVDNENIIIKLNGKIIMSI